MTIAQSNQDYIPAAGHHWSLPLYDPLTKVMGVDQVRKVLLEQARLQPSHRVLDLGCGTGTFAVLIKRSHPQVDVTGLDPDPDALGRARRKASRAGTSVQFDQGMAGALPYPADAFDYVFSSFTFHHLQGDEKPKMLREVRRVLAPGGRLEMVDFAGPDAPGGFVARLLQSHHLLRDNSEQRIVELMSQAGLRHARCTGRRGLLIGAAAYYEASRGD
jgi:ubiquinone/menaquinone biosynthesis C-methylase UbiE